MTMQEKILNFRVFLVVNTKNKKPALEIRRLTTDTTAIKLILEAALLKRPVVVFPTFRDDLRAIATLSQRKFIKYNYEKSEYEFLI